jgi:hypothetical protein
MECECCHGCAPPHKIIEEVYTIASCTGQQKRKVCVLCKDYLPIRFNDCYGSLEWQQHRNRYKKLFRRLWTDLEDIAGEVPPPFLK